MSAPEAGAPTPGERDREAARELVERIRAKRDGGYGSPHVMYRKEAIEETGNVIAAARAEGHAAGMEEVERLRDIEAAAKTLLELVAWKLDRGFWVGDEEVQCRCQALERALAGADQKGVSGETFESDLRKIAVPLGENAQDFAERVIEAGARAAVPTKETDRG